MGQTPPRGEVDFDLIAPEYDVTRGGAERATDNALDIIDHLSPDGEATLRAVLDIGAGTGIVAEAILAAAPAIGGVYGVDISAGMLERASARLPGHVVRASAQRLPFADGRFDAVVAVHVLHLVPDMTATLAEARRVLRPRGRVVAIHDVLRREDGELTRAMRPALALDIRREDSAEAVRTAGAAVGLAVVEQHPSRLRTVHRSPAEQAEQIRRRTWSHLWNLTDAQWEAHVEPALKALDDLPDQHRRRAQVQRMTVTVLERVDAPV
jgi:SAM-dependent methyltransferase